jgi:hypothetical protein
MKIWLLYFLYFELDLDNSSKAKRVVLSDWGNKGHYLEMHDGKIQSYFFE